MGTTVHINDIDTGLTYMQQRYYDPVAGRFLSVDPVITDNNSGASFNRYVYAENNPYKYIDPDGRQGLVKVLINLLKAGAKAEAKQAPKQAAKIEQQATKEAMARGRESETRVLKDLGEAKNTTAVGETGKKSIPDFQNSKQVGEIKDRQRVTDSQQLRTQREHAAETGREHVVVTGSETKVSKTVETQSTVIRREDLGPKKE